MLKGCFVKILSILAEPHRLKAVRLLSDGKEHCVCKIMQALNLSHSTASRHMSALKRAGLVEARRESKWVHYKLASSQGKNISRLLKILDAIEPTKRSPK
jgi:ArsR family transcriptional regulator